MSNILKATTPIQGYENSVRTNSVNSGDVNIRNVTDPGRVMRPDMKGDAAADSRSRELNYESNYDTFVQMLKNSPDLTELFTAAVFSKALSPQAHGVDEGVSAEVFRFMEMIPMNRDQLLLFLKEQTSAAQMFKGAFFDSLRLAMEKTDSVELKTSILEFLKKYNDLASGPHILKNIWQNLKNISRYLPISYRGGLEDLMERLDMNGAKGDTAANIRLLKDEVIPYLSNYFSRTYDMGKARDFIALLTLNIARYENGSGEGLAEVLRQLLGYGSVSESLKRPARESLKELFAKAKPGEYPPLMDRLLSVIQKGMDGGAETRAVFENLLNAMVINQSVYMPLLHLIIPARVGGRFLFSEIWADPDDENENQGSGKKARKIFIKFCIDGEGYFELIMAEHNGALSLWLGYPEKFSPLERQIKNGISGIVLENGFKLDTFSIGKVTKQKSVFEVFPKLYERKNAVNVRV